MRLIKLNCMKCTPMKMWLRLQLKNILSREYFNYITYALHDNVCNKSAFNVIYIDALIWLMHWGWELISFA